MCKTKDCQINAHCVATLDGQAKCVCPLCDDEYDVICGNDGINYASQCWMERESCLKSKEIKVAKKEPCSEYISYIG